MSIGIIGVGRLGTALAKGFIDGGVNPNDIYVYDVSPEALKRVEALGVKSCKNVDELANSSRIIIVAVKPSDVLNVIRDVAPWLNKDKILVSVAAFIPLKAIERYAGRGSIYRAMPNIAVEVNKGFTALSPPDRRCEDVEKLFSILGDVVWVKEEVLDLLTVISASTPAIVVELVDTFILAALKAGVPYDIARKAVTTVFQGVGKLAEVKDVSSIRDSVITPRGSTIILVEKFYTYEVKSKLLKALVDSIEEYIDKLEKFKKDLGV